MKLPESLSQAMLVGIMLVGRLGVQRRRAKTEVLVPTGEHIVRDVICVVQTYAGSIETLPGSSNQEPDFMSHLPAS